MDEKLLLQHLEYAFVAKQFQDLMNIANSIKQTLKVKPKDITMLGSLRKLNNDINMLTPLVQANGIAILKGLEDKYSLEFKFLIPEEPKEKRDSKVLKFR